MSGAPGQGALSGNNQELLPIFGRRHVVPGLEGRRKRADVRVAEQHCDFQRFQACVSQVVDREFRTDFREDFLETGLLGLESTLEGPAAEFQGAASCIRVGFATSHQIAEPAL